MKCIVCGVELTPDRIEGLAYLDVPETNYTCLIHSPSRVQGIYNGESGTSPMIVCDRVGGDVDLTNGNDDFLKQIINEEQNETTETDI